MESLQQWGALNVIYTSNIFYCNRIGGAQRRGSLRAFWQAALGSNLGGPLFTIIQILCLGPRKAAVKSGQLSNTPNIILTITYAGIYSKYNKKNIAWLSSLLFNGNLSEFAPTNKQTTIKIKITLLMESNTGRGLATTCSSGLRLGCQNRTTRCR